MCQSEGTFGGIYEKGPHPCPIHPEFDRGDYYDSVIYGYLRYRRECPYCKLVQPKKKEK